MRKFFTASVAALALAGTLFMATTSTAQAPMAGEGAWPFRATLTR